MKYFILYELKKLRVNECFYIPANMFHHGLVVKHLKNGYVLADLSKGWIVKGNRQDIMDKILVYGRDV